MRLTCLACGQEQLVPAGASGKAALCKQCGERLPLTSGGIAAKRQRPSSSGVPKARAVRDPDRPRCTPERDDRDDDDERAAPNRTLLWCAVGGGLTLLLLVGLGVAVILHSRSGGSSGSRGSGDRFADDHATTSSSSNPSSSSEERASDKGSDSSSKSGPEQPNPPPPDVPKIPWRAAPDPGENPNITPKDAKAVMKLKDTAKQGDVPGSLQVIWPEQPARMAVILHGPRGQEGYDVINLEDFSSVSFAIPQLVLTKPFVSADCKFLRGTDPKDNRKFKTISVRDGKLMPAIDKLDKFQGHESPFHFLPDGKAVTLWVDPNRGELRLIMEVWDLTTGQMLEQHDLGLQFERDGVRREAVAVSPGGGLLAAAAMLPQPQAHPRRVFRLYAIPSGDLLGELPLPESGKVNLESLAFSPDGKQLACSCTSESDQFGRVANRYLLSWNLATGDLVENFRFTTPALQGGKLRWLSDSSTWLIDNGGEVSWLDVESAEVIYKTPSPDIKTLRDSIGLTGNYPLGLVGRSHVMVLSVNSPNRRLGLLALPEKEITAAADKARVMKAGVKLPAAIAGNFANAAKIEAPGEVNWQVNADPVAAPQALGALALPFAAEDIQDIAFTPGVVGEVVITRVLSVNPAPARQFRAERFSLVTGKQLASVALFTVEQDLQKPLITTRRRLNGFDFVHTAVSPDGSQLLVRRSSERGRLDLWDLDNNKHLAGWLACDGRGVDWFDFLDATHVAAASAGDKLILWKVPDCSAVYIQQDVRSPLPSFSAGRKYLAFSRGKSIELTDPATGACQGRLPFPSPENEELGRWGSVCFSPDGKEIAVPLAGRGLSHWDIALGKFQGSIYSEFSSDPILYVNSRNIFCGIWLYDWSVAAPLAEYDQLGAAAARTSPDGRNWIAKHLDSNPNSATVLAGSSLPDAKDVPIVLAAAAGKVIRAFPPGASVEIRVTHCDGFDRAKLVAAAEASLQKQGFKIGPGELVLVLDVELEQKPTSKIYKNPQTAMFQSVNYRAHKCMITWLNRGGTNIAPWATTPFLSSPKDVLDVFQGKGDEAAQASCAEGVAGWAGSIGYPVNAYKVNGEMRALPRGQAIWSR